jgi:ribonuclease E
MKRGQKIIVQVRKEGIGTKGPALTTYISLPGKYIVLMPWLNKVGVSQKIEDQEQRSRLKEMINGIEKPRDAGFIVRTAGEKATKKDIESDLAYLCRLWDSIQKKQKSNQAPCELYQETNLAFRAIRDIFNSSIRRIICDAEDVSMKIHELMNAVQPRYARRISYYDGVEPLFHKYGIEKDVEKINESRVELRGGGSIVLEQTEALVAIDVNSGKMRQYGDIEKTAYKTNLEAAKEIARQLRLRDLGGIIVCDFIDMERAENRRDVEKAFRDAVKPDRARYRILRMSGFCLIEMTRQRMRPSLERSVFQLCPKCGGAGIVKSYESIAIQILRLLQIELAKEGVKDIQITSPRQVADYLLNNKRMDLAQAESEHEKVISVKADNTMSGETYTIVSCDERGRVIN